MGLIYLLKPLSCAKKFDESLGALDMVQHMGKAQRLYRFKGDNSGELMKEANNKYSGIHHARYLGPQLACNGSNTVEVDIRVNSAMNAFWMFEVVQD